MIEVIKPGTKNRTECNNCGALLSYSVDDVKSEERYIGQRESYIQEYIDCPQCRKRIALKGSR